MASFMISCCGGQLAGAGARGRAEGLREAEQPLSPTQPRCALREGLRLAKAAQETKQRNSLEQQRRRQDHPCRIQGKGVVEAGRDSDGFLWLMGAPWLWVPCAVYGWLAQYFQYRRSLPLSCSPLKLFIPLGGGGMENVVPSFWV